MLRFSKLRLAGFKSFVDPTELVIEPGMTGVVGPNGCGKSNLVEALRWVMGETSARQMRGGEMDDVIFGGTANRPARNIAEVMLALDNRERSAPAALNDHDELEVVRRIERQKGSLYKVNGREVRARDVQLLFADAASGARSTAMVSQGRVGAVIAAKPAERRMLLEEAAGITGLHSRRHEAENRLRGAENNLTRLDDILGTLEVQLQSLKKQARQAIRYRNLSDTLRKTEATLYHLRWGAALDALDAGRTAFQKAEGRVAELTGLAAAASTGQAEAAADLPELRKAEVAAAAELQRLVLARDGLDAEEKRLAAARLDAETRLAQTTRDLEREQALADDATAAMARLDAERATVNAARAGESEARDAAEAALAEVTREVTHQDGRLAALTEKVAADEARRTALARSVADAENRARQIDDRLADVARQREALRVQMAGEGRLAEAEAAFAVAARGLEEARGRQEAAETARAATAEAAWAAMPALHAAQAALGELEAEERALARVLDTGTKGGGTKGGGPPLVDALTVEPGWEAALGAALGDDLSAPVDAAAPIHWDTLPPLADPAPLPAGAGALSRYVQAPPALARRLAQVGVVGDGESAEALRLDLRVGQRLVDRRGALWRWDGYTVAAGAPSATAARLEQRNQLADVRARMVDARTALTAAEDAATLAQTDAKAAAAEDKAARDALRRADADHGRARDVLVTLQATMAKHASRLEALDHTARSLDGDRAEAAERRAEVGRALAEVPDPAGGRAELAAIRDALAALRRREAERRSLRDSLHREAATRAQRLEAIARELDSWTDRGGGARGRMAELAQRQGAAEAELAHLAGRPEELSAQRRTLMGAIDEAEKRRQAAADRLAEAETLLASAEKALRQAETDLATAREDRVRAEGAVEQGRQTCRSIAERINDTLECRPEDLPALAGLDPDGPMPVLDAVESRLDRLQRERDTMGPVNLRAEQEAQEMSDQIASLRDEREDLIKAIDKLRQGINELNREGRQRLLAAFNQVDRHFQELFVRLFGGGRAHLALTESDDPLQAGLEIMASPPGKKLQTLSLLSGGEQALTALALLFGVFLVNPAPICVLDEVDAPLDDANVDRFCTLVDELARGGHTRFLVITHHRMTMARMDRLFGVTMTERGVSQLVSVDLRRAEALRESA